jgi:small conductance mechanosensitive channel
VAPPALTLPWPVVLGASGQQGTDASQGWVYDALTHAGVSPSAAHDVDSFVVRPLGILLVLLVAYLVARIGARAIRRAVQRASRRAVDRSASERAQGRAATMAALASNVWRFVVFVVAAAIVLGMLGINLTPLLASATVIGATIGFGAQALVRDYLSGFLLTMEDQFGIGDSISVNGTSGVVEDVSLRVTRVRAADGTVWFVPNGEIRKLANRSRGWAKAVIDVPVTVSPDLDLPRASELLAEAAAAVARQPAFAGSCPDPPEVLGVVAADAATCTLRVTLRTTPGQRVPLERALRAALTERMVAERLWPAGVTADGTDPTPDDGPTG